MIEHDVIINTEIKGEAPVVPLTPQPEFVIFEERTHTLKERDAILRLRFYSQAARNGLSEDQAQVAADAAFRTPYEISPLSERGISGLVKHIDTSSQIWYQYVCDKKDVDIIGEKGKVEVRYEGLSFSLREIEILASITQGKTNEQIAQERNVERRTIRDALTSLYNKNKNAMEALGDNYRHERVFYSTVIRKLDLNTEDAMNRLREIVDQTKKK